MSEIEQFNVVDALNYYTRDLFQIFYPYINRMSEQPTTLRNLSQFYNSLRRLLTQLKKLQQGAGKQGQSIMRPFEECVAPLRDTLSLWNERVDPLKRLLSDMNERGCASFHEKNALAQEMVQALKSIETLGLLQLIQETRKGIKSVVDEFLIKKDTQGWKTKIEDLRNEIENLRSEIENKLGDSSDLGKISTAQKLRKDLNGELNILTSRLSSNDGGVKLFNDMPTKIRSMKDQLQPAFLWSLHTRSALCERYGVSQLAGS